MGLPSLELNGKVAIVTGSTKGIGYGLACGLAQAGADVVITSRHQDDCIRVADEISKDYNVKTLALAVDVTKGEQVQSLMQKTVEQFGHIDVLVNNAGTASSKPSEDLTERDWNYILEINQKAVFFTAQAVGKQMIAQKSGKIINVASIFGLVGSKAILPYCVSKGGVLQMTKTLALEWAEYNIQVNALCPGYIITPMNEDYVTNKSIHDQIISKTPMKRFGEIEDMKGPIVFLASESSNYMTGQTLTVDGGWTSQ